MRNDVRFGPQRRDQEERPERHAVRRFATSSAWRFRSFHAMAAGPENLFDRDKTGFFCSSQCPGRVILKTFAAITAMRDEGRTLIGGFHSPMEWECLGHPAPRSPASDMGSGTRHRWYAPETGTPVRVRSRTIANRVAL